MPGNKTLPTACLLLALATPAPAPAQPTRPTAGANPYDDLQKQFAEAYNRQDAAAMAEMFTQNAVRITPTGIFQGRDAIRREMENTLKRGLHDYTVRRIVSRSEGNLVFNAGDWQATFVDKPLHGYYSVLLTLEGDHARILQETVNVAASARQ